MGRELSAGCCKDALNHDGCVSCVKMHGELKFERTVADDGNVCLHITDGDGHCTCVCLDAAADKSFHTSVHTVYPH